MRKAITTSHAPQAIGPYSQAVSCGDYIFCSGQIPVDPKTGEIVSEDIVKQTHQVMQNIQAVLNEAGANFDHVVKSTIYLQDLQNFSKVNEVYAEYLTPPYPARATVEVAALPKGAGVEIEVMAHKSS